MLVLSPLSLGAQEVEAWFSDGNHLAAYGSIRQASLELARQLEMQGLTDRLLMLRLEEAYRKRIAPSKAIESLKKDVARFGTIAGMLASRNLKAQTPAEVSEQILRLDIFLRAGLSEQECAFILDIALGWDGDRSSRKSQLLFNRITAAMAAVLPLRSKGLIDAETTVLLAGALIMSDRPDTEFSAQIAPLEKAAGQNLQRDAANLAKKLSATRQNVLFEQVARFGSLMREQQNPDGQLQRPSTEGGGSQGAGEGQGQGKGNQGKGPSR
ncbi:MAG: hypothetical protein WHT81_02885 [Rectinemataceae bacterium]|nr:hypothetical protein [Spirochaetaceae bacterium]